MFFTLLKNKKALLEQDISHLKNVREDLRRETERDEEYEAHLTARKKLEDDVIRLEKDISKLKSLKKVEEEELKHMMKILKERDEIALEKKIMANDKSKAKAIADVKDTYRDKMEERLETEVQSIKEMYSQILERLPNVSAAFNVEKES